MYKDVFLKILMLVDTLNTSGGTERVCSMLTNELSNAGYEMVLVTLENSDKPFFPINKNIKIIPLVSYPRSTLGRLPVSAYDIKNLRNTIFRIRNIVFDPIKFAYKIRKISKEECVDIVIAADTMLVRFVLPAILGLQIKLIGWEHMNFNANFGSRQRVITRQFVARYCDAVVTLTEKDRKYWLEGTSHKSQITAIANSCPFPVQEYIKEEDTKIVLAVGRLTHIKGFDMLLDAWIQVNKSMPDWTLKIVGEGEDREKLTDFIKKNKLTDSVELVGNTDNVGQYYKEAEIFCLSSRMEGFPMVLLETLAFGLPVVSFNCDTGPAEILEDTGSILAAKNDVDKLALSLIELMKDDERRAIISLKSKDKARLYQPEKIVSQWVDLLENLE